MKKYDVKLTTKHTDVLRSYGSIEILQSGDLDGEYVTYVYDLDDAQIVQDAVDANADYIITKDTKGFDKDLIYHKLGIRICYEIPSILFNPSFGK